MHHSAPLSIALDREFVSVAKDALAEYHDFGFLDIIGKRLSWSDLLARRRVVLLAEGGSGKSTELKQQVAKLAVQGKPAFLTTLEQVGRKGSLEQALGRRHWAEFEACKSGIGPVWLLLDSIDEAKKKKLDLAELLADVAAAIEGAAGRVHIVLTGRHSDWAFRRDLSSLLELLPLPPPDQPPKIEDPDAAFIAALRPKRDGVKQEAEGPLVVAMASLDRARVRRFAEAHGVPDFDVMAGALNRQDLWSFAGRPLDLQWLVAHWRQHGKFGTLLEMIDQSLSERLQETNPTHARDNGLGIETSLAALRRLGAALVLMRLEHIAVPDLDLNLRESAPAVHLSELLPDWDAQRYTDLLLRPVFDLAAAGYVRLHNDNQGAVRGFLAARWLHAAATSGVCTRTRVAALLFADAHGLRVVRPSMRATTAWLSLFDDNIASEVLQRDPRLLMDAGDPGSLSLAMRIRVLDALIELIRADEVPDVPDHDALRRFAKPDLAAHVAQCWVREKSSGTVRSLLALLMLFGEMTECSSLALEAATSGFSDRYTGVFGGRAVAVIGTPAERRTFVDYMLVNTSELPAVMIWDALESLYPATISLAEMLELFDAARALESEGTLGTVHHGMELARLLPDATAARGFVTALSQRLDAEGEKKKDGERADDEALLDVLEAGATRLLELTDPVDTPLEAIDAALRVGKARRFQSVRYPDRQAGLEELLRNTPARRRQAVWRAAEVIRASGHADDGLVRSWHLQWYGFNVGLVTPDIGWLIGDMRMKASDADVRLATELALDLWDAAGQPPELLERIKQAAQSAAAAATVECRFTSRLPSAEQLEAERLQEVHRERSAIEQARGDEQWKEFASALRADPDRLRRAPPPTALSMDPSLYNLWKLLRGIGENSRRNAIADLSPICELMGDEVADALRDAFIAFWRHTKPTLPAERVYSERSTVSTFDMVGLVGVTQEALRDPLWAEHLDANEARLATRLATTELNGFPLWLTQLAQRRSVEVGEVLWRYLEDDLRPAAEGQHPRALETLAGTDDAVIATIADRLLACVESSSELSYAAMDYAWRVLLRVANQEHVADLAYERFQSTGDPDLRALHISVVFIDNAARATNALVAALDALGWEDQVALSKTTLPRLFGRHFSGGVARNLDLPVAVLERLVRLAFAQIRPADDNFRPSGESYSPDPRDDAESARSAVFTKLLDTPGLATFEALQRLRADAAFPVADQRMRELMRRRAELDSEGAPWRAADVREFERDCQSRPASSADLQRVALARLEEIENELQHGDYQQGRVVARLPAEVDVQQWFGQRLRDVAGNSYTHEREAHVAEEKSPDIRLQSRVADGRMPIEIKVAESWSIAELEEALVDQLAGRYLRDRDNRFGILLLVHQKRRSRGWESPHGKGFLNFAEVVSHLRKRAREVGAVDAQSPQMQVCTVDVSACWNQLPEQ